MKSTLALVTANVTIVNVRTETITPPVPTQTLLSGTYLAQAFKCPPSHPATSYLCPRGTALDNGLRAGFENCAITTPDNYTGLYVDFLSLSNESAWRRYRSDTYLFTVLSTAVYTAALMEHRLLLERPYSPPQSALLDSLRTAIHQRIVQPEQITLAFDPPRSSNASLRIICFCSRCSCC